MIKKETDPMPDHHWLTNLNRVATVIVVACLVAFAVLISTSQLDRESINTQFLPGSSGLPEVNFVRGPMNEGKRDNGNASRKNSSISHPDIKPDSLNQTENSINELTPPHVNPSSSPIMATSSPTISTWSPTLSSQDDIDLVPPIRPGEGRFIFFISGEPTTFEERLGGKKADILLTTGGANLDPSRMFYLNFLVEPFPNAAARIRDRGRKMRERTFADVIYRSSTCAAEREDAVRVVRLAVEKAGFRFVPLGRCQGSGYPYNPDWEKYKGPWTECAQCSQAKIMLSFERFEHSQMYLAEKLFTPYQFGAIPAYRGNGQTWIEFLSVNPKSFINWKEYDYSMERFAEGIVSLLKNETRLQQMQDEEVYSDYEAYHSRVWFWKNMTIGLENAQPVMVETLKTHMRYQQLKRQVRRMQREGPVSLSYYVKPQHDYIAATLEGLLRQFFPEVNTWIKASNLYDAYIQVDGCCY